MIQKTQIRPPEYHSLKTMPSRSKITWKFNTRQQQDCYKTAKILGRPHSELPRGDVCMTLLWTYSFGVNTASFFKIEITFKR